MICGEIVLIQAGHVIVRVLQCHGHRLENRMVYVSAGRQEIEVVDLSDKAGIGGRRFGNLHSRRNISKGDQGQVLVGSAVRHRYGCGRAVIVVQYGLASG